MLQTFNLLETFTVSASNTFLCQSDKYIYEELNIL